jgi:hypothetical protein
LLEVGLVCANVQFHFSQDTGQISLHVGCNLGGLSLRNIEHRMLTVLGSHGLSDAA